MPAHIFIQGDKFANTQGIVQWIASRTGWPVLTDKELFQRAGSKFGLRAERIERTLFSQALVMSRVTRNRKRAKAFLLTSLAETLRTDAGILWGMAGHLIPKTMPHLLRVLITADSADRIQRASQDRNIPEKEARQQIKKTDRRLFQWQRYLFGDNCFDAASYDVVIPTSVLDKEEAALLIFEHLTEKANATPDDVGKALDDFALAADVQLVLAEKGYDITASADSGHVTLTIDSKVLRLKKIAESLKRTVSRIPHVTGVEVKVGRNFHRADISHRYQFETSPGLQFTKYADRRRRLRQSAINNLPSDIKERPLSTQIGIGRPLSL